MVAELRAHGHERASGAEGDMIAGSSARPALADLRALSIDKDFSCQTPVLERIERFFYSDQVPLTPWCRYSGRPRQHADCTLAPPCHQETANSFLRLNTWPE